LRLQVSWERVPHLKFVLKNNQKDTKALELSNPKKPEIFMKSGFLMLVDPMVKIPNPFYTNLKQLHH